MINLVIFYIAFRKELEMKVIIINIIIVFFIKVFDNMLGTSKTILIQKNRSILASLTVIVSQVIFYKLINVVGGDQEYMIYVIAFASGVGTLLALIISNKFSKEKTYVNVILSDNKEEMILLRDFLKDNKITNLTTDAQTKDWKKTIAITAYAETKAQSKLIDNFIRESDNKFKRIINVKQSDARLTNIFFFDTIYKSLELY